MTRLPKSLLHSRYPFKNLVFQGGGVKAYVYHGVLRLLGEYDILSQIERVAGTSAGALQATMLCFRLSTEETIDLYKTVDYSKIRSTNTVEDSEQARHGLLDAQLGRLRGNLDTANRFFRNYGLYSIDYLQDWLHTTIAKYCNGNGRATFADFRASGFRDLYTTAVNVSQHRAEIFSVDTTPDVAVADAVVMSAAIPFFFEAIQFDGKSIGKGDHYIDGGALSNYPLTIFDDVRFEETSKHFTYGVNWETLGCQLFTPDECSEPQVEIHNVFQYAESIFETMSEVQKVAVDLRTVDRWRSMQISNCCVSTTDFDLLPEESNPKYVEMVQTGEKAARKYLAEYRLPTDRFAEAKGKLADLIEMWR
jgi:NTE family protein